LASIAPVRRDAVPPVRDGSRRSGATAAQVARFRVERLAQRVLYQIVKGDFMPRYAVPLLLVISFTGCVDDPDLDRVEAESGFEHCSLVVCGGNSPIVRTHPFKDMKFSGWSDNGFRLHSFFSVAWEPLTLQVVDGRLRGRRGDGTFLVDDFLVGARIRVVTPAGEMIWIRIQDVEPVTMWAHVPGFPPALGQMYLMQWEDASTPTPQWKNLCSNGLGNGEDPLGMTAHYSVVYEKDRIDAASLTVFEDAAYFSIGCAGHAIAKMYLTGHTHSAAAAFGLNRTVARRTAMLKVLTADYCGNGTETTIPGVRLQWKASDGTMDYPDADGVDPYAPGEGLLEARWNDQGQVICLEDPRLVWSPPTVFGDVEAYIATACVRPPTCSDLQNDDESTNLGGGYLVTRVPVP
jgi:hypothetical protein